MLRYLYLCCFPLLFSLVSCTTPYSAPVVEGWKESSAQNNNTYRVQKNDTLYSIAWAFGVDYHELARVNHIGPSYRIAPGQILHMSASHSAMSSSDTAETFTEEAQTIPQSSFALPVSDTQQTTEAPIVVPSNYSSTRKNTTKASAQTKPIQTKPAQIKLAPTKSVNAKPASVAKPVMPKSTIRWAWPTTGSIVRGYSATSSGNKGIDIAGRYAQPITAAADGKVVYTGASLPGYGNLIILKHASTELSAYAFNKVIMVKEGQVVKAGQTIAQMGKNESGRALLHFEIRKNGKPVNPMPYLKK